VVPTPTLSTDRLLLRPFEERDRDDLVTLQSDAEVLRYWDSPPWTDPSRATTFLDRCRELEAEGTGARVVVERAEGGAFVGWCSFVGYDDTHRSATVGYCLAREAWGHGYATEAARALLGWAFDAFGWLHRVQAEIDTRNAPSGRVLEKLGFRREGTLREDCWVAGQVSDTHVYGLLRGELSSVDRESESVSAP
jgi:RimJ/RimL family protein N-acetyltransferase